MLEDAQPVQNDRPYMRAWQMPISDRPSKSLRLLASLRIYDFCIFTAHYVGDVKEIV